MTATVTATFTHPAQATAALEALHAAGFIDGVGVWSTRRPQPVVEVRGAMNVIEVAWGILQAYEPAQITQDCQTMPLEGYDVESSAHTQKSKTAAEQWRARRAELASTPQGWAAARRALRFGGASPGQDGAGGSAVSGLGSSTRDRHVAVRDDQGPRTLTGRD